MEPEDITESPSSRAIALTPNQLELLQIFSAFPDNEQQEIIKELRNKKEAMEDFVARWLAQQGRRA
ncbi:Cro/Cl family transcriptional regulator [Escherichia coli]|uniref:Cro/Cl family transcriptional regulator n=1 Tax=Escherichia coli TaxID=562 RepID=A0A2K3TL26_ECOLX|nr:Cro/Cl family transcriptional regulator [Escherichia coli]EFN7269087.1 Cro/Cl family transcriptional regulator [Escherichia coli O21]EEV5944893.1 Cro/Cl family transcriptional regulator [Escherichia coli]EEW1988243.1 Cro/Cl family transcriptional regulator [Escherichia coli]EEW2143660.1 Cro/Cl family transcriptional regulator [Escherichia coli]